MIFPHFIWVNMAFARGPLPALPGFDLIVIPGTLLKARRGEERYYVQRADAGGGHRLIPVQYQPAFRVDLAGALTLPATGGALDR